MKVFSLSLAMLLSAVGALALGNNPAPIRTLLKSVAVNPETVKLISTQGQKYGPAYVAISFELKPENSCEDHFVGLSQTGAELTAMSSKNVDEHCYLVKPGYSKEVQQYIVVEFGGDTLAKKGFTLNKVEYEFFEDQGHWAIRKKVQPPRKPWTLEDL